MVDNSVFSPNRLTIPINPAYPSLLRKLPMLLILSKEDSYEPSCVLVLVHALSGTALSSILVPSLLSPLESSSEAAHQGPTSSQATLPLDCPACRLASPLSVRPWREMKSRRGAPKRVNTEGFACPNRECPYR
jgi:hypothetical protein